MLRNQIANGKIEIPFSIDCFQNLLLLLLIDKDVQIDLFTGVWPWVFYRNNENGDIRYRFFITKEDINKKTKYKLAEVNLETDILKKLISYVDIRPVIINVDQFYVKHHYPDIYHKVHGPHSLLLFKYEEVRKEFLTIGVMPEFIGWVSESEIEMGISNFPMDNKGHLKCCWLEEKSQQDREIAYDLTRDFLTSMKQYEKYEGWTVISIYEIYDYLNRIWNYSKEDMEELCKKRWIWEIDRLGKLLIYYLESDYCSPVKSKEDRDRIVEKVKNTNSVLTTSFRKIAKGWIGKRFIYVDEGINGLYQACLQIEQLKETIRREI